MVELEVAQMLLEAWVLSMVSLPALWFTPSSSLSPCQATATFMSLLPSPQWAEGTPLTMTVATSRLSVLFSDLLPWDLPLDLLSSYRASALEAQVLPYPYECPLAWPATPGPASSPTTPLALCGDTQHISLCALAGELSPQSAV